MQLKYHKTNLWRLYTSIKLTVVPFPAGTEPLGDWSMKKFIEQVLRYAANDHNRQWQNYTCVFTRVQACCISSAVLSIQSFTASCHVALDKRLSKRSVVETRGKNGTCMTPVITRCQRNDQQSPSYVEVGSRLLLRCFRHIISITTNISNSYWRQIYSWTLPANWRNHIEWNVVTKNSTHFQCRSGCPASTDLTATFDRLRLLPIMTDNEEKLTNLGLCVFS